MIVATIVTIDTASNHPCVVDVHCHARRSVPTPPTCVSSRLVLDFGITDRIRLVYYEIDLVVRSITVLEYSSRHSINVRPVLGWSAIVSSIVGSCVYNYWSLYSWRHIDIDETILVFSVDIPIRHVVKSTYMYDIRYRLDDANTFVWYPYP